MNRNQPVGILLAALLVASGMPAGASLEFYSFSGTLAPANWTENNYDAAYGSYAFSGVNLALSASASTQASDIVLQSIDLSASQASIVKINWSLTANGSSGIIADYDVSGSAPVTLTGSSGFITINVPAGDTVSFELADTGTTAGKNPAALDFTVVPEPGPWVAGVFLLGFIGFDLYRRKSRATDDPST